MDGNYPLKKEIGNGSYGKVYQAYDKKTQSDVAVKRVLKKDITANDYLYKAFWKELDIMKKCDCQNTVKFLDFVESVNNYNIVMELCDTDLDILLNRTQKGFATEEIKKILLQLNNVFAIMAKEHIMHRDLKLKNILIKFTDQTKTTFIVKLSDFGFSKVCEGDSTSTKLGTPVTMAPEIIRGEVYTNKADLWSIGVIIYQLLFKELPYRGRNEKAIYQMILQGPPKNVPSDPMLKNLLMKLLTFDPLQRITWEEYFNHPFFLSDVPVVFELKELISSFYNNDSYQLWKGIEIANKRAVYIKKIKKEGLSKEKFDKEISLMKLFTGNKYVCQYISHYEDRQWKYIVSEYFNGERLDLYASKYPEKINEDYILQLVREMYENIFSYADMNQISFDIISNYTFMINTQNSTEGNALIKMFDFGLNYLYIDKQTLNSCNYNNIQEQSNQKGNVLNLGCLLYKIFFSCNINMTDETKSIKLPKKVSKQFKTFLSKCCYRNSAKRYSWEQIGKDPFVIGIVPNEYTLQDSKLELLLSSFTQKVEKIISYYTSLPSTEINKSLKHINIFLFITLIEVKMVQKIFTMNNHCKEEELHLMQIFLNGKFNYSKLNFALNNSIFDKRNPLIAVYMKKINNLVQPLTDLSGKMMKMNKQIIANITTENSVKNIITDFHSAEIHSYFFELFKKGLEAFDKKDYAQALQEFYIAQFLYENIIFVKLIAMNQEQTVELKEFLTKLDGEEDEIYVSAVPSVSAKPKNKFVLFTFLGGIATNFNENDITSQSLIKLTNTTMNELIKFYPDVLKMTISAESNAYQNNSFK